ncbi:hypothetical protein HNQ80_002670 [Anaerosolibacter carboniphilus]|uniref:Dienelactone hydrolase domain-containing protein n=1 Tax=Anaerosolibacter carboniphilus TaxID=1417629 RepID=A0A841KWE6_9FIRM|nr:dienelactone hydrolase family protein [Anaerosolibacter carboniphilus]MBB6216568.1 hypothetical protein [Anaerosolibacter carboniphilus]
MVWSIFKHENSFITTTREEINGVPCLKLKPNNSKGLLPTVINYHGWHSNKDFKRFESLVIASHGYQVFVPDALHHGDKDPIDHDDPENLGKYLWKIILQSVKESKKFIEQIINNHEADSTRIGIIGDSMGAITAGGVFVYNLDLKCLVGYIGTFAWQEAIKVNHLPPINQGNRELIEYYDPMNNEDKIKDRAILMLNGTDDTSLPINSQRGFFNKMLPLYKQNTSKFELVEVANVNHLITTGMLERAVMWFKEHL